LIVLSSLEFLFFLKKYKITLETTPSARFA